MRRRHSLAQLALLASALASPLACTADEQPPAGDSTTLPSTMLPTPVPPTDSIVGTDSFIVPGPGDTVRTLPPAPDSGP